MAIEAPYPKLTIAILEEKIFILHEQIKKLNENTKKLESELNKARKVFDNDPLD